MIQTSSHTENLIAFLYPKLSHPKKSRFSHFFTKEDSQKEIYQYPIYSLTPSFNHKPRSKLAISIESIDTGIDTRTSVMIKNIPITLSKEKTIMWILSICNADYIYIPIDQNEKKILGFAFVNVVNCKDILRLYQIINEQKYNNGKKIEICYSKMQGVNSLIKSFGKEYFRW